MVRVLWYFCYYIDVIIKPKIVSKSENWRSRRGVRLLYNFFHDTLKLETYKANIITSK